MLVWGTCVDVVVVVAASSHIVRVGYCRWVSAMRNAETPASTMRGDSVEIVCKISVVALVADVDVVVVVIGTTNVPFVSYEWIVLDIICP